MTKHSEAEFMVYADREPRKHVACVFLATIMLAWLSKRTLALFLPDNYVLKGASSLLGLFFLIYLLSVSSKHVAITVAKHYGFTLSKKDYLNRQRRCFVHFDDIERCVIYEYISAFEVQYKLGIKLKTEGHYFKPICVS